MIILELVFLSLSLVSLLQVSTKNSIVYSISLVFFAILMAGIAGFRVSSPDYANYHKYFILLSQGADYRQLDIVAPDPAFAYLNYLLSSIYNGPLIIFIFFSFVSVSLNAFCYKKYVKYFFISMLFYLVHTYVAREMMQIRAGLACAICLYSLKYIEQSKIWSFTLIVLVASMFHLGACSFLVAYPIGRMNLSSKKIMYTIVCSFAIALVLPFGSLFKTLPSYGFLERIQYYNETTYGEANGLFSNVIILKELIVIIICLYFRRLLEGVKYFKISLNLYFFSLIWLVLWNDFSIVASRIATFYSITEVLLFAMLPYITKSGISRQIVMGGLIFCAGLIMFLNLYGGKWDDIIFFSDNLDEYFTFN